MEEFSTIVTSAGNAKIVALLTGGTLTLAQFAVGDSNGAYYDPDEGQTSLVNEMWRGPIASIAIDPKDSTRRIVTAFIPANVGGWWVREAGLYTDDTPPVLFALAKIPAREKVDPLSGSAVGMYIKLYLDVNSARIEVVPGVAEIPPVLLYDPERETYPVNESVSFLGSVYVCIVPTTAAGQDPLSAPTHWQLISAKGDTGDVTPEAIAAVAAAEAAATEAGALLTEVIAVIGAPRNKKIAAEFFGIHYNHAVSYNPNFGPNLPNYTYSHPPVTPFQDMGFGAMRLWDTNTTWMALEPVKGAFNWAHLDELVAFGQEHGMDLMLTLGQPPSWASGNVRDPDHGANNILLPTDNQDWVDYVAAVGNRYHGSIKYYEVWNEPPGGFAGTAEQLVTLTQLTAETLKGIDDTVKIISAPTVGNGGLAFFEDYLAAGGGDYVDVIGVHLYVHPNQPEDMIEVTQKYRALMYKYGIGTLPLWNTETGWFRYVAEGIEYPMSTPMGNKQAAAYTIRMYLAALVAGIDRCYFYTVDNTYSDIHLLDLSLPVPTMNAAGTSVAAFVKWMVGHRIDAFTRRSNGAYIMAVSGPEGQAWIAWSDDNTPVTLTLPAESGAGKVVRWDGTEEYLISLAVSADMAPAIIKGTNLNYHKTDIIPTEGAGGAVPVYEVNGLGHGPSDAQLNGDGVGLLFQNATPAISSLYGGQDSPIMKFLGMYWDVNSNSSQPFGFAMQTTDTSTGSGTNHDFNMWSYSAGAWRKVFSLDAYGQWNLPVSFAAFGNGQTLKLGLRMGNDSNATALVNQTSPFTVMNAKGWTTASGVSKYMSLATVMAPETGVNTPIGVLRVFYGTTDLKTPQQSDLANELLRYEWGERLGVSFNQLNLAGYTFKVKGAISLTGTVTLDLASIPVFADNAAAAGLAAGTMYRTADGQLKVKF